MTSTATSPTASRVPGRVLVVEDDELFRKTVVRVLAEDGHGVECVESGADVLPALAMDPFDVVLLDIGLPIVSGLDLLVEVRKLYPRINIVMVTGGPSIETCSFALRSGAFDYLAKPLPSVENLRARVFAAVEDKRLRDPVSSPSVTSGAAVAPSAAPALLGEAAGIRRVRDLVGRVARSPSNVLVLGESGTGKELVARALHEGGPRADRPFVPVNCAAIAESLLESELFGHVRGAFTGAHEDRDGLFVAAHEGTLFLDEIGELPIGMQAKLLRTLEDGEVRRVGSPVARKVDVRVIAATNVDLRAESEKGGFRADLYFRLKVLTIDLPPLRRRKEDVPLLAMHFLRAAEQRVGRRFDGFDPDAMAALAAYPWPGNVRELAHVVERAALLAAGDRLALEDLGLDLQTTKSSAAEVVSEGLASLPYNEARQIVLESFERRYVASLLRRVRGNVSEASRLAGMDRANFRRVLRRAGLDPAAFTTGE